MDPRFLVWGDVIDDIVVRPAGSIRADTDTSASIVRRAGGSAANVASWLGALGETVDFVGRVGADDVGRHTAALGRHGVTAHLAGDEERPTGTIVILVAAGDRTMLTERGANVALVPHDVPDELIADHAVVHFTGYSVFDGDRVDGAGPQDFQRFIARCDRLGVPVSVDPSSAGYLLDIGPERFLDAVHGATVLLPNRDEAAALTGLTDPVAAATALGRLFPVVAITAGREGTLVVTGGEPVLVPVTPAAYAEPTGAGDAFSAGFLSAWVRDRDAPAAALAGASVAARALVVVGGRPAPPARPGAAADR